MRLIDADALQIKHLEPGKTVNRAYTAVWNSAASLVEAAPTIDAVPVVRCEVCRYSRIREVKGRKKEALLCNGTQSPCFCRVVRKDYFCPRGERMYSE